jgi:GGDEF domain-containing protein
MNNIDEIKEMIFFENDGEIDLLTGAMAPNRFNQIVKRDIDISERNGNLLSIISLKVNISDYLSQNKLDVAGHEIKFEIEEYLIAINFKLKSILRSSDCISRVSKTGFWIFINSINKDGFSYLENRIRDTFPPFVVIKSIHKEIGQNQMSWYQSIDLMHFDS